LLVLVVLVMVSIGAMGCGDGDEPVATEPDDPGAAGTLGGGETGLAVLVEHVGGDLPGGRDFARLPATVVYDDGTSITQGVMIQIYPGPAVPPLVAGQLGEGQLEELHEAAAEAGLLESRERAEFGEPPVAGAPDTRITLVIDGQEVVNQVAALGIAGSGSGAGLTEEQAERRAAAQELVDLVTEMTAMAETGELVEVDRYRVLATPYGDVARPDEPVEPNTLEWPAEVELVKGACIPLTGSDAEALDEALADATEITRWTDDEGQDWHLAIRPVLPHEPDC
jgi:hypothetical protein